MVVAGTEQIKPGRQILHIDMTWANRQPQIGHPLSRQIVQSGFLPRPGIA